MLRLNKIYCVDCLEGMKHLDDKSVDIVITDSPYNINLTPKRNLTDKIENDNLYEEVFRCWLNNIFVEINRVLKNNSFLIIFTGWSTIPLFRSVLDRYFTLKSMPIWVKNNFGIGYYTRPQYESAFLYFKGNPRPLIKPISDVWKFNRILRPVHSCEKPVKLMRFIIKSFIKENEIILDPFSGVGPVSIAAKELNRKYIAFELEQRYIDITNKRLQQEGIKQWF